MTAQRLGIVLLFIGILSCTSGTPTPTPAATPAVVKPPLPKDEQGNDLPITEIVPSEQVQIDNRGVKTVTVGNANGDYALACNMQADNCTTPVQG